MRKLASRHQPLCKQPQSVKGKIAAGTISGVIACSSWRAR